MSCRREKGTAQIPYAPGVQFPKVPWDVTALGISRLKSVCFSANRRGVDGSGKQIAQP
ncbi:hypothetical protein T07_11347 [Trichinella nelsoni]|uniref:Uncharacterized protein n=1 Tax=Trichinella nelsoni TaxID=6336 RepID=A0A0V0RAK7_9BILA|nr:hypothetical protein T07_11347 [Trichinella nelsoni]